VTQNPRTGAAPPGHRLIDLGGPLLGGREEHAPGVGDLRAYGVLPEQCDERGGVNGADGRPVRKTEAVDGRVEAVVDAVRGIHPGAVGQHVATRAVGGWLAVAARQHDRCRRPARPAGRQYEHAGERGHHGPATNPAC
jgi:hypothetical protein